MAGEEKQMNTGMRHKSNKGVVQSMCGAKSLVEEGSSLKV